MKLKKKICKCGCGREGYIWARGMLKECAYKDKKPKGLKKISDKGKAKKELKKALFPNDAAFYFGIWSKRPHVCFNCGKDLGERPLTLYFDHILEKGNLRYEHLRHNEDNICLLCWDCHTNKSLLPKLVDLREKTKEKFDVV